MFSVGYAKYDKSFMRSVICCVRVFIDKGGRIMMKTVVYPLTIHIKFAIIIFLAKIKIRQPLPEQVNKNISSCYSFFLSLSYSFKHNFKRDNEDLIIEVRNIIENPESPPVKIIPDTSIYQRKLAEKDYELKMKEYTEKENKKQELINKLNLEMEAFNDKNNAYRKKYLAKTNAYISTLYGKRSFYNSADNPFEEINPETVLTLEELL